MHRFEVKKRLEVLWHPELLKVNYYHEMYKRLYMCIYGTIENF